MASSKSHHAAITFTTPLSETTTAKDGEKLTLECETSLERARVEWYRNGKKLKHGRNYKISSRGRKRIIVIPDAKRDSEDSVNFSCKIIDNDESTETSTKIVFPKEST